MKKIIILITILIISYIILYKLNSDFTPDNGIPIIKISLTNTNIETINKGSKKKKYYNNKIKIEEKGKTTINSTIMIKGRGNYTWTLAKKPYQITFDEKTSILDLPKSKKFVLLANYSDPSLLRNDFSYSVAKKMNLNYSFTGKFADLYVDGKYIGNYYVTPKIDINKATANLKDDHAILMELDNTYYMEEKDVFQSNEFGDHIVLKDSNGKEPKKDMQIFQNKYNDMEQAIINKDYEKLKKIIDVDSFVKYYIISEFSENSDSIHSSLYMYMDGNEDKIHIGPLWDCDLTYGIGPINSDYYTLPIKNHLFPDNKGYSILLHELLKIDEFSIRVKEIWNEQGKDIIKKEIKNLDKKINYLKSSGVENNLKWKKNNYNGSTEYLKEWLQHRMDFFDQYMNS